MATEATGEEEEKEEEKEEEEEEEGEEEGDRGEVGKENTGPCMEVGAGHNRKKAM